MSPKEAAAAVVELMLVFLATSIVTMGSCMEKHVKGVGCGRQNVEAKAKP